VIVPSPVPLIPPAYNYTKLVEGIIQTRKPSCLYHVSRAIIDSLVTCKLKKGLKWGCHPSIDWMCLLRVGKIPAAEWRSRPPSGGNPSSRVGPSSGKIPAAELDLRVKEIPARSGSQLLSSRENPINRVVTPVKT